MRIGRVWVEPVTVTDGVPIPPRTMYAVKEEWEGSLPRPMYGAYWSETVATRIAAERAAIIRKTFEHFVADMRRDRAL